MNILILLTLSFMTIFNCSGNKPDDLGVREGKLKICPDKPNCVNSQLKDNDSHYIEPITFISSKSEEKKKLKSIIANLPRTQLIKEEDGYLYYEFTSMLMRYVDDVEFYFDDSTKLIHVRSASRLGHSDLGVNRKRIESIRQSLFKER
jgi:uncharacterized protein (DUF1499 family)